MFTLSFKWGLWINDLVFKFSLMFLNFVKWVKRKNTKYQSPNIYRQQRIVIKLIYFYFGHTCRPWPLIWSLVYTCDPNKNIYRQQIMVFSPIYFYFDHTCRPWPLVCSLTANNCFSTYIRTSINAYLSYHSGCLYPVFRKLIGSHLLRVQYYVWRGIYLLVSVKTLKPLKPSPFFMKIKEFSYLRALFIPMPQLP